MFVNTLINSDGSKDEQVHLTRPYFHSVFFGDTLYDAEIVSDIKNPDGTYTHTKKFNGEIYTLILSEK